MRLALAGRQVALMTLSSLVASCATAAQRGASSQLPSLPAAYEAPASQGDQTLNLERWWQAYRDPQVDRLVDDALAHAPDAEIAAAELRRARAVRDGGLTGFDPQGALLARAASTDTATLSGPDAVVIPAVPAVGFPGASFNLSPSGYTHIDGVSFDVSWELDLFGRRAAARAKANADLDAAKFDYGASRASLVANVVDLLFQARGLVIERDDAEEACRIQKALLRTAEVKADHRLGARSDAAEISSELAVSQAQAAELESRLHAVRRALMVLLGRGGDPLDNVPISADIGAAPAVPPTVPGDLMVRRPDVRKAGAEVAAASGKLRLDRLALFPKFTLEPGVGLTSTNVSGNSITSDAWSIGLGMAAPVLDRPRLQAEIRAQSARTDAALIAYEKTVQTAYGEAESALVTLAADEHRVALLTAGETQGRLAYDAARRRYEMGISDLDSALTAELTWRRSRTALSDAKVQTLRHSVKVFKVLGGGWTPVGVPKNLAGEP